jgi:hypothetical protein
MNRINNYLYKVFWEKQPKIVDDIKLDSVRVAVHYYNYQKTYHEEDKKD